MNIGQLFDNVAVTDLSPNALMSLPGFSPVRKKMAAFQQIQIAECAALWRKFIKEGSISPHLMREAMNPTQDYTFNELRRLAPHIFHEAMSTSDFTNLTTGVLERMMLANYAQYPSTYDQVCKINPNIVDFRSVERWQVDGGEGPWHPVDQQEGFNRGSETTGKYTYSVKKYRKGMGLSWEAVINDDMGQFLDLPQRLATGGKRTIEHFWLQLIAGAAGPNTSFYGTAISLVTGGTIKNVIDTTNIAAGGANNPPLDVANFLGAVGLFMNQMSAEGVPINIATDQLNVVVADGVLWQTLMNMINMNQFNTVVLGGSKGAATYPAPDVQLMVRNWITGRINPIYAPELRNIMTSNAATSWWLFAKPGAGRPALELGFLRGFQGPQLYRKVGNMARVGGGVVEEFGDYDTMTTEFSGLTVFGGTRMDPRMTMSSNGTGS